MGPQRAAALLGGDVRLSLSKRLPFTVSIFFHPASLPHLLFSVLLPSNTVNLLEQRLSSHRPHDTNTVGSLSTAGKQAFFFFSFFFQTSQPDSKQQGIDFILGSTACPGVLDADSRGDSPTLPNGWSCYAPPAVVPAGTPRLQQALCGKGMLWGSEETIPDAFRL